MKVKMFMDAKPRFCRYPTSWLALRIKRGPAFSPLKTFNVSGHNPEGNY
jgi:hypothetical protein